jgi:hypothetical protein
VLFVVPMRIVALLICLISLLVESASGQTADSLPLGQYVRVTDGKQWQYGTLEHAAGDSLVLSGGDLQENGDERLALPLSSILRLQAWTGRRGNPSTGLLIGGIIGIAGGAAAGAGLCTSSGGFLEPNCADAPVPEVVGGVIGGLVLGGMGALIGWAIKTDHWEEVPLDRLRVGLVTQPGEKLTLGLSMRF